MKKGKFLKLTILIFVILLFVVSGVELIFGISTGLLNILVPVGILLTFVVPIVVFVVSLVRSLITAPKQIKEIKKAIKDLEEEKATPARQHPESVFNMSKINIDEFYQQCDAVGVWVDYKINDEQVRQSICENVVKIFNTTDLTSLSYEQVVISEFARLGYTISEYHMTTLIDCWYEDKHNN